MGRKTVIGTWRIELSVQCPHCGHDHNAMEEWHELEGYDFVEIGQSKRLNARVDYPDFPIQCSKCNQHYSIKETEY